MLCDANFFLTCNNESEINILFKNGYITIYIYI